MGIRFRKRMKVAPGVYINLSKSGTSTTIKGLNGISMNIGNNGVFVNTSIPGTGIYSREKLGGQQNVRNTSVTKSNNDLFETGCLISLIIFSALIIGFIVKAYMDHDWLLFSIISLIGMSLLIFFFAPDDIRKESNLYEKETKKAKHILSQLSDNDTEKKNILSSYIDCLSIDQQIDLEERILNSLVAKRKKKYDNLINEHSTKISELRSELETKRYDVCKDLSNEILENYKEMCLSLENLENSECFSYCDINGNKITLNYGVFDYLKCSTNVPALTNLKGDVTFYIYPRFVIKAFSNTSFQVIPIKLATLNNSKKNVSTSKKAFADCQDVTYEFLYTTKDGSPDLRHKDNPLIKTMKLSSLKFSFIDEDILVSNKELCDEFVDKYKKYCGFFNVENNNENKETQLQVEETPIYLENADPLLWEAAEIVIYHQQGSTSFIQRMLKIGYNRAITIIDQLEKLNIVGNYNGSVSRKVLIKSTEELKKIKNRYVELENTSEQPYDLSNNADNPQKTKSKQVGLSQLDKLIGLDSVKQEVKTLSNFIKIQISREQNGLTKSPMTYHCVFTGNPGTGKTTVARILARIYKDLGVLKKGHLVETDRSGLVAEYVGQTAVKTNKIIDSALDGVLFIDEAYSLAIGGSDYGMEAIATLLKRMEDNRDRLIVILAGYTNEMENFINSNPGLKSRFSKYIEFPDYNADELFQILLSYSKKQDYLIDKDAYEKLKSFISDALLHKDNNWGNARWIRNVFEQILNRQANRLASTSEPTKEQLREITIEDCP